ncbi:hypothetical protein [Burkholderia sp. L27(2015)]|uniref:hypothetical protein n=1 Tax=Burkholderia sp. L27(2015) TaxID=1641858 RepID=UPI00131E741E|nr:hypothetical protein [Burkholderia sp. L27(2015)]
MNNFSNILWIAGVVTILVGFSGFVDTRKVDRRFRTGYRNNAIDSRDIPRAKKRFLLGVAICMVAFGIGSLGSTRRRGEPDADVPIRSATTVQVTAPDVSLPPELPSEPIGKTTADTVQDTQALPAAEPKGTFTASFNCSKAHSDSEVLICNDAELAAADVDLAGIYVRAKAAAKDPADFKEGARLAWSSRELECHDKQCLVHWYAQQKLRLENIAKFGE